MSRTRVTGEESPPNRDFHWLRGPETLYLIGKPTGDTIVGPGFRVDKLLDP